MKPLTILFLITNTWAAVATDPWFTGMSRATELTQDHRYAEALKAAQGALAAVRHTDSKTDTRAADAWHLIGSIERDMGSCQESRASFAHAIDAWEQLEPARPELFFASTMSLLNTLCECDMPRDAEKTLNRYEAKLEAFAADPLHKVQLVAVRGTIARHLGRNPAAEAYRRQEIELLKAIPGAKPELTEKARIDLAEMLRQQGRTAEATAMAEEVLRFVDRSDDIHNPAMLTTLNNTACLLDELGHKDEAVRMLGRAVTEARIVYGEDTRLTAKIMMNYAAALRASRQNPKAAQMEQQAQAMFRRTLLRDGATVDVADLLGRH
jgi:tetratricopeptide (TPR) repeat protein